MRIRYTASSLATLTLLGALAGAQSANAQGNCGAIQFTNAILSQFPEARNACLGIEMRNGQPYAHFDAEVVSVSGSQVRAKFKLPSGQYSETYTFTPNPDARVTIAGRQYRYRDLTRGQELDIYLPPDRWEFIVPETETFASATTVQTVTPTPDTGGAVAQLPRTASPLPLLGLLGGLFTALGFGLTVIRRRLS